MRLVERAAQLILITGLQVHQAVAVVLATAVLLAQVGRLVQLVQTRKVLQAATEITLHFQTVVQVVVAVRQRLVLMRQVQMVAQAAQACRILFQVVRCNTAVVAAVGVAQQQARVALAAVAQVVQLVELATA